MQKFTNPLNNIKIASPCSADWNKMYGSNRQRFCQQCNQNVYNLSDMTKDEAESFLVNSEGRVCVKFYRRKDGTVLTQNCPVGWQAVKKRISRATTAIFSMIVGILSAVVSVESVNYLRLLSVEREVIAPNLESNQKEEQVEELEMQLSGAISNLREVNKDILKSHKSKQTPLS